MGVGGHAERRVHEVTRTEQALRALARHLAAGIRLGIAGRGLAADNGGRGDLQGIGTLRGRHQGEGALACRLQLQAAAAQQLHKAFVDAVAASQAAALAATDQRRINDRLTPAWSAKQVSAAPRLPAGTW